MASLNKKLSSKPGNAQIKRQGQTSSGDFGTGVNQQAKWGRTTKDLKIGK